MLNKIRAWFLKPKPVLCTPQNLLQAVNKINVGRITRNYAPSEQGKQTLLVWYPNAFALYNECLVLQKQLNLNANIRLTPPEKSQVVQLSDYLSTQDNYLRLDYFLPVFKEQVIATIELLQLRTTPDNQEYYRVKTQLLIQDLNTFTETLNKI